MGHINWYKEKGIFYVWVSKSEFYFYIYCDSQMIKHVSLNNVLYYSLMLMH